MHPSRAVLTFALLLGALAAGCGGGSSPSAPSASTSASTSAPPSSSARAGAAAAFTTTVDADVYFCPERHGTYYGGFYIKDAPAIGHEGYSIDEQLTATAGSALSDSSKGYVTADQAALVSSLVATQRDNLYASPSANIVGVRTEIAKLLRGLLTSTAGSDGVRAQVLALSATYGELDGENNWAYATVFAQLYRSLSADQRARLAALRTSIMSGTYADGTRFDYSVCTMPFLYSAEIRDRRVLEPYLATTDALFFEP